MLVTGRGFAPPCGRRPCDRRVGAGGSRPSVCPPMAAATQSRSQTARESPSLIGSALWCRGGVVEMQPLNGAVAPRSVSSAGRRARRGSGSCPRAGRGAPLVAARRTWFVSRRRHLTSSQPSLVPRSPLEVMVRRGAATSARDGATRDPAYRDALTRPLRRRAAEGVTF